MDVDPRRRIRRAFRPTAARSRDTSSPPSIECGAAPPGLTSLCTTRPAAVRRGCGIKPGAVHTASCTSMPSLETPKVTPSQRTTCATESPEIPKTTTSSRRANVRSSVTLTTGGSPTMRLPSSSLTPKASDRVLESSTRQRRRRSVRRQHRDRMPVAHRSRSFAVLHPLRDVPLLEFTAACACDTQIQRALLPARPPRDLQGNPRIALDLGTAAIRVPNDLNHVPASPPWRACTRAGNWPEDLGAPNFNSQPPTFISAP